MIDIVSPTEARYQAYWQTLRKADDNSMRIGGMGLITTALMLICAVLHISGLRGANAVGKFRDAQAY